MIIQVDTPPKEIDSSLKIIQKIENTNALGSALKAVRLNANLSIPELAKLIWVYEWRLKKAEDGQLLLNHHVLHRIAKETGHIELQAYFLHLDALTRHGKRLKRVAIRLGACRHLVSQVKAENSVQ